MTFTRRARELVIVAILLALPVLFLRASLRAPEKLSSVDRAVMRVSAPMQGALVSAALGVTSAWRRYVALWGVSDENRRLREENARLRSELARLQHESDHGRELEALLKLKKSAVGETMGARVIAAQTSAFFKVIRLRLDRGELEVKPGMAVLASAGVVGRVERVFGPYCDVVLASDPKSAIDVVVPRTGGRGVARGKASDSNYRARLDYLLRNDDVKVGDEVVTSGLGGFPRNLPVGKIVAVQKRDFGLYQDAEIDPAVEFSKLSEVLIVVAPELPPHAEHP
jgi:rod shape-determining protein MreC